MLTPQEQALIAELRANAEPSGADDGRTKSELRRGQRRLLAIIDRLTGTEALRACALLVKWHSSVFDGGKQALRFDNGYPVDRTDVDEAARLAQTAIAGAPAYVIPAPAPVPMFSELSPAELLAAMLCDDCPPPNQFTDGVRCRECPRRKDAA